MISNKAAQRISDLAGDIKRHANTINEHVVAKCDRVPPEGVTQSWGSISYSTVHTPYEQVELRLLAEGRDSLAEKIRKHIDRSNDIANLQARMRWTLHAGGLDPTDDVGEVMPPDISAAIAIRSEFILLAEKLRGISSGDDAVRHQPTGRPETPAQDRNLTRPASMAKVARLLNWDVRQIRDTATLYRRQIKPGGKLWLFDLDEIDGHSPSAAKELDPEG